MLNHIKAATIDFAGFSPLRRRLLSNSYRVGGKAGAVVSAAFIINVNGRMSGPHGVP
ncbi:MAG TPA: hypothetical protein VN822_06085 [Candidatus Acidoferrales bacterium]|nr:hypothetical protein [Candidatus Acidoferrales bacterium]